MSKRNSTYRYCHVQVRTWTDAKFRLLSKPPPNAQTLWLFLLCGDYTKRIPGVIDGGRAAMAETLDWDLVDFDRCFGELAQAKMAIADWKNQLVYLPNAFKQPEHRPTSTNVVVMWRREMTSLPECDLRLQIEHDLRLMLLDVGSDALASYDQGHRTDLERKRAPIANAEPATATGSARFRDPVVVVEAFSDPDAGRNDEPSAFRRLHRPVRN